mmetsp:Transcript_273/g.494  ORF Transcript_273/g.494 Transcript_273/m.494 type:complete len:96 (+) Transcript_273:663-950(+)
MSSSHVPLSTIFPFCTTAICSESRIVVKRCAMVIVVRFFVARILSSAVCTASSADVSRAEVASSRRSTSGCLTIARAIATRCFWPPESLPPRRPT